MFKVVKELIAQVVSEVDGGLIASLTVPGLWLYECVGRMEGPCYFPPDGVSLVSQEEILKCERGSVSVNFFDIDGTPLEHIDVPEGFHLTFFRGGYTLVVPENASVKKLRMVL